MSGNRHPSRRKKRGLVKPVVVGMTDWGVPDWQDSSAYPAAKELTLNEWRWQFLRRRIAYREAWRQLEPANTAEIYRNQKAYETLAAFGSRDISLFLERVPTDDSYACQEKFGLAVLLDPRKNFKDWDLSQAFRPLYGYGFTWKSQENALRDEAGNRTGIMFDLTRPLPSQLAKAKSYLLRIQRELYGRPVQMHARQNKWPLYLRALDAADAGASYIQMASVFFPKERSGSVAGKSAQSARDTLEAAELLRNTFPK